MAILLSYLREIDMIEARLQWLQPWPSWATDRVECHQSIPITSVRWSWPMQIVKGSLYVMIELLKMADVS